MAQGAGAPGDSGHDDPNRIPDQGLRQGADEDRSDGSQAAAPASGEYGAPTDHHTATTQTAQHKHIIGEIQAGGPN